MVTFVGPVSCWRYYIPHLPISKLETQFCTWKTPNLECVLTGRWSKPIFMFWKYPININILIKFQPPTELPENLFIRYLCCVLGNEKPWVIATAMSALYFVFSKSWSVLQFVIRMLDQHCSWESEKQSLFYDCNSYKTVYDCNLYKTVYDCNSHKTQLDVRNQFHH